MIFFSDTGFGQKVVKRFSTTDHELLGISFADSLHGLVHSSIGNIYMTSDGGRSWNHKKKVNGEYLVTSMVDSMTVFVICKSGQNIIYRTTDGGNSWYELKSPSTSQGTSIAFYSPQSGFLSTGSKLFKTTDSANSWIQKYDLPNYSIDLIKIYDSLHIAVLLTNSVFLYSDDGGETWVKHNIPHSITLSDMCFVGENNLIVGSRKNNDSLCMWLTTDRGFTWSSIKKTGPVFSLASIDSFAVLAQVNDFDITVSYDRGKTWREAFNFKNFDSSYMPFSISILPSGNIFVNAIDYFTYSGSIIYEIEKNNSCDATDVIPIENSQNILLSPNPTYPNSITAQWRLPDDEIRLKSVVQISSDSTFPIGSILEVTTQTVKYSTNTYRAIVPNLSGRTEFYWRVGVQCLDGKPSAWSRILKFKTAGGIIQGIVYDDLNKDGFFTEGEKGMGGQQLVINGSNGGRFLTDSLGRFMLQGLDTGNYSLKCDLFGGWKASTSTEVNLYLGANDSIGGIEFGKYYPWATLSGKVFYDVNENGSFDSSDTGVNNCTVRLHSTLFDSLTTTNEEGDYIFGYLEYLACSVFVATPIGWEKITPRLVDAYTFESILLGQQYRGVNFALHPVPSRIKIPLYFHIPTTGFTQKIVFGVRDGATFGIWDTDPQSSNIDFSEGESELPPQGFTFCDARFVSPRGSSLPFGEGAWIDMRAFSSPAQVDTYRVSFKATNGDADMYPVVFRWSKEQISNSYNGSVVLRIPTVGDVDMKSVDSAMISDAEIHFIRIFASYPVASLLDVREGIGNIPSVMDLRQNYPNPFNPVTVLSFALSHSSLVTLKVYDMLGKEVASIYDNKEMVVGAHEVNFDASILPSGVYFYHLNAGDFSSVRKMVLVR